MKQKPTHRQAGHRAYCPNQRWQLGLARCLAMLLAICGTATSAGEDGTAFFEQRVAPILASRCLECHNTKAEKGGLDLTHAEAAAAGGDSGATILVAGKPQESHLWERIAADEMPPKHPLPEAEKVTLRTWIERGAKWGKEPIERFRYSTTERAGYDWWALQPVRATRPPPRNSNWTINPIDSFILARLQATGLEPSPPADRRTLIRRVYFTLIGLPPTPEEVDEFLADPDPKAYEKLVDRLLDSPHYGERWARHWLDVARFGESQGFERDKLRPNAWPYRDWVIQAFNNDLPYDEFVRLQLAGDVLQPSNPLAVIATGFLVASPWDEVGHTQQSPEMRARVRDDEMEDYVGTICQTFLGLTANCARCHDHKFDPISQEEYFQIEATVRSVRHGERESVTVRGSHLIPLRVPLTEKIAELDTQIAEFDEIGRELAKEKRRRGEFKQITPPKPTARWDFDTDANDGILGLKGTLHGSARLEEGRLILDGTDGYVETELIELTVTSKTLEAWIVIGNVDQRNGGIMTISNKNRTIFDAITYGERQRREWLSSSERYKRTQPFRGGKHELTEGELVHVAIVYQDDGFVVAYVDGQPYGKPYQPTEIQRFHSRSTMFLFGQRPGGGGLDRHFVGAIDRAHFYDHALTAGEILVSSGVEFIGENELVAALPLAQQEERNRLVLERSRLRLREQLLTKRKTYAVVTKKPSTPNRPPGQEVYDVERDPVAPRGFAALSGLPADFGLEARATDRERRKTLAEWITDQRNPLTTRVIVNRLWHYHFGVGLVDTPNDFGFNGGRPTHPELLDWLASQLQGKRWSLKAIQRLILNSATYRQQSDLNPDAVRVDADNRLLWRKTPLRLDAEALRDYMLSIGGRLNPTMGGPSFRDFRSFTNNTQFYEMLDREGYEFQRRSIYRMWVRSGRNPFLDVFDCPDPSTIAPKRAVTTTPLQALSLLHDSFALRTADNFASRLQSQSGADVSKQVDRAYRIAYGRPARPPEMERGERFVNEYDLAAFCRVILNTNEFLYID